MAGVRRHLESREKVIALTLDACGSEHGKGVDIRLIDFLTRELIPATLFINARWIDANPDLFRKPGSDWDLRAAVLLRFAGGGGFVRRFLSQYRGSLAALPEGERWGFLAGKLDAAKKHNRAANVDEKMSLAAKLGYQPL